MKKAIVIAFLLLGWVGMVWAADTKTTALTEDTTPTDDDIIPIVDDPASAKTNKKVTKGNLMNSTRVSVYTTDAPITNSLVAAESGAPFTVIIGADTTNQAYNIDPNGSEEILLDGVTCGAGKYVGIADRDKGDAISCRPFKTAADASAWYCSAISGAWTCEP